MKQSAFQGYDHWYKGNLHTHTNRSDGALAPMDAAEAYASRGYDFLALTDHKIYNRDLYLKKGLLILPGVEADVLVDKLGMLACHHMVGLGLREKNANPPYAADAPVFSEGIAQKGQALANYLADHDCLAIYAHPHWSRLEPEDLLGFDGFFALEVFNNVCDFHACGVSDAHWDALLRRGRRIWAVATDDAHGAQHYFGGWVMVNAPELTQGAILDNLISGNFYATTGPEIYEFTLDHDVARVRCSPACRVDFITWNRWGCKVEGSALTEASFRLNMEQFQYVRVQVTDKNGERAWTNPIFAP